MSVNLEENVILQTLKNARKTNPFKVYFNNHLRAAVISAGKLSRTPIATFMTLIVLAIALALPTSLFVLLENAKQVSQRWDNSSQISLYLKLNISPNQTQNLIRQLKNDPKIAQINYISPAQGLAELQNQTNVQNELTALNANPLPGVILVQPNSALQTPEAINQLLQTFKHLPGIDIAQFDMQWIKRLYAMIDLGKHIVYALGFLLAMGVLFIIGNTIHLNLQRYRREIEVLKLVGATDGFIRRPFLYTGMLYGFLGSVIAWMMVSIILWCLANSAHRLALLYGNQFQLAGLNMISTLGLIMSGSVLGLIGAWIAVGRHLRA